MKTWLLSIVGLILFIGLALWSQHQIQKTTDHLDQEMKQIQLTLLKRDWESTLNHLHRIQKNWRKTKPLWAMILRHQEIDAIDQALVRTICATKSRNYSQSRIELGSLKQFIEHVPDRERFSIVNIL